MTYFFVALIALIVGMIVGAGITDYLHRCTHNWEKIIDNKNSFHHVIVHRCTKCGKKITTKADFYGD